MEIKLLADHSEAIATLADWYISEWQPYYGAYGPGDAVPDLASRCNRGMIPVGLIALWPGQPSEDETERGSMAAQKLSGINGLSPAEVGLVDSVLAFYALPMNPIGKKLLFGQHL